jgi:hypothetical protein
MITNIFSLLCLQKHIYFKQIRVILYFEKNSGAVGNDL